jgi:hypothetical protein
MNVGLKGKTSTDQRAGFISPRTATMKSLTHARSKSEAVAAIAQAQRTRYSLTLAPPAPNSFKLKS